MTTRLTFDKITVDIAAAETDRLCCLILPVPPKEEDLAWMEEQAGSFGCSLAAVAGVDWNHDMTPWEAPDIGGSGRKLKGRGAAFLERFRTVILPAAESVLPAAAVHRLLIGVSLSGLFALWAASQCGDFERIGSVSGSLWYDGFTGWLAGAQLAPVERFYLSLGDRERFSKDERVATVEDRTLDAVRLLREKGFDVVFEMNPGTHFAPMYPRLGKALAGLLDPRPSPAGSFSNVAKKL